GQARGEPERRRGRERGEKVGVGRVVHVAYDQVAPVRPRLRGDDRGGGLALAPPQLVRPRRLRVRVGGGERDEVALQVVVEEREQPPRAVRAQHVDLEQVAREQQVPVERVGGVLPRADRAERQLREQADVD